MSWSISSFIKSFIVTFLLILLIVNIYYAFDMSLGFDFVNGYNKPLTYTDKYFGVSTFLEGWNIYWYQNTWLNNIQYAINTMQNLLNQFNWANAISIWRASMSPNNGWQPLLGVLEFLANISNYLFNMIYILGIILMIVLYVVYAISFVFQMVSFIFFFLSGTMYSDLPNTYPPIRIVTNMMMYA